MHRSTLKATSSKMTFLTIIILMRMCYRLTQVVSLVLIEQIITEGRKIATDGKPVIEYVTPTNLLKLSH